MFPAVEVRNTSWKSPCLPLSNTTNMHQIQTEETAMALSDSMLGYNLAAASGVAMAIYFQLLKYYVANANPIAMNMWCSVAGHSNFIDSDANYGGASFTIRSSLLTVTAWPLHSNRCMYHYCAICPGDFICSTYKPSAIPQPCSPSCNAVHVDEKHTTSQGKLVGNSGGFGSIGGTTQVVIPRPSFSRSDWLSRRVTFCLLPSECYPAMASSGKRSRDLSHTSPAR